MADLKLIETLSNIPGAPGDEGMVARAMIEATPHDVVKRDRLGSAVMEIYGASEEPRIALVGHLDEVGFIVENILPEGLIRFLPLGGWMDAEVNGLNVLIKTRSGELVSGYVGGMAPHRMKDRIKATPIGELFIDIGARSGDEVTTIFGVGIGDTIIPDTDFKHIEKTGRCFGKAFDDRLGVSLAIEAARKLYGKNHPNTILAIGSTQEEVGTRGAQTSAFLAEPDIAFILEGPVADDTPGGDIVSRNCVLGQGVQIRLYDPSTLVHRGLSAFVLDVAADIGIKYQMAVRKAGGTDARQYNISKSGIPSIVLSVPVRYAHTSTSVFDIGDYDSTLALTIELCKRLDSNAYKEILAYY
jgi:endoglucanase